MINDEGLIECEDCGATFPDDGDGLDAFLSHCCHIDNYELEV